MRRRVQLVEVELQLFQGLLPQLFAELGLLLAAFGERVAAPVVLQVLRRQGSAWLTRSSAFATGISNIPRRASSTCTWMPGRRILLSPEMAESL